MYYYLTTLPRQPLPENSDDIIVPGVDDKLITPSVSSVDQDEEDALTRERSPSPEVDLSSPDFDDEHVDLNGRAGPGGASKPGQGFSADHRNHARLVHSHRAVSPPLEGDEREFTQTASAVRERASGAKATRLDKPESGVPATSDDTMDGRSPSGSPMDDDPISSVSGDRMSDGQYDDYFSHMGSRDQEQDLDEAAAVALFGTSPSPSLTSTASSVSSGSSPATDADEDAADTATDVMTMNRPYLNGVPVSTIKRPISVPDVDMKMSDLAEWTGKTSAVANVDIDMITDSWIELQSPETVEVDELDEMFGEI